MGVFHVLNLLNYANGTKSCKTLHILQSRLLDYSTRSQCTFLYSLKTSETLSGGRERVHWEQMGQNQNVIGTE